MALPRFLFLFAAVLSCRVAAWLCRKSDLRNGILDYPPSYRYTSSNSMYYTCNPGYGAPKQGQIGKTSCTKNGWSPEPRCLRICPTSLRPVPNADTYIPKYSIVDGDAVRFDCYPGYKTFDGNTTGELTCLPNGQLTTSRCSRICPLLPELRNGVYKTERHSFVGGQYVTYECDEEFVSANGRQYGRSRCDGHTWTPKPHCKEIFCSLNSNGQQFDFRSDDVMYFKCPEGTTLEGAFSSQCFYYGWGPALPVCRDADSRDVSPLIDPDKTSEFVCPPAVAPPNAEIRNQKDKYSDGEMMRIVCHPGYRLVGSERALCQDGKWQDVPYCEETVCQLTAPLIQNGSVNEESLGEQYYTGSVVKYRCQDGYHTKGSDESRCTDREWIPQPACVEKPCGKAEEIKDGDIRGARAEYKHGERAVYQCREGYAFSNGSDAQCLYGKWQEVPECVERIKCPPPQIENGEINPESVAEIYYAGDTVRYQCQEGYKVKNSSESTCMEERWQPPLTCIEDSCGAAVEIENGNIWGSQAEYNHGDHVSYECSVGYKLSSEEAAQCVLGKWQNVPECVDVTCDPPPDIRHGRAKAQPRMRHLPGKRVYYGCSPGYTIGRNLNHITCEDSHWTEPPACRRVGDECNLPPVLLNGEITEATRQSYPHGSSVEYTCVEGYILEGSKRVACRDGQWEEAPLCRALTTPSSLTSAPTYTYRPTTGNYDTSK